jgi:hypothetical protein
MLLKQLAVGAVLFTVFALVLAGVWYGTRVTSLTLVTVAVAGGETIDHNAVEIAVQGALDGAYLGIIPRRFAWWYPQAAVYDAVHAVPRVKDPQVMRMSGTELAISFDEYVPFALWCADKTNDTCIFIDETGYAFTTAPKLTGGALVRYRSLGATPRVGDRMTSAEHIQTMTEFIRLAARDAQLEISLVEFDSADDVFYVLAGGGELRATLRDPATQVLDNLRTILASKEFSHIEPGNFQYIDLRFGNKVFVNEELGVATSTASELGSSTVTAGDTASTTR